MATTVNENSACTIRVSFFDEEGEPLAPASARYCIRDITNARLVLDWTTLPSSETSEIAVTATQNIIYNDSKQFQEHAVAVQANPGLATQFTNEARYKIKNLSAFKS